MGLLVLAACGAEPIGAVRDASARDASARDTSAHDSSAFDSSPDASAHDSSAFDSSAFDSSAFDSSRGDASSLDGPTDAGSADASSLPDGAPADAASVRDAGARCPTIGPATVLGRIADPRLSELSGIAAGRLNPDVLWVHNDNAVTLFAVERSTLAVRARYVLTDANGDPYGDGDVEDIAILERPSGPEIYLGDIGSGHPDLVLHVYRVREPLLPTGSVDAMLVAERMNVSPTGLPNAETLLVDPIDGNVVIVEKDNLARVCDAGPFQTSMLVRASCTAMVDGIENPSAGDVSPDGATIAIRNELTAQVWLRRPGRPLVEAFLDPPCPFATLATPQSGECNGEALAFSGSGREIFSGSERVRGCEPDVHAYSFTP